LEDFFPKMMVDSEVSNANNAATTINDLSSNVKPFDPIEHGLESDFRLTNYCDLNRYDRFERSKLIQK
jgi:hypothetical protein